MGEWVPDATPTQAARVAPRVAALPGVPAVVLTRLALSDTWPKLRLLPGLAGGWVPLSVGEALTAAAGRPEMVATLTQGWTLGPEELAVAADRLAGELPAG